MSSVPPQTLVDRLAGSGGVAARARAGMWQDFLAHSLDAIDKAMRVLDAQGLGFDHHAEPTYWRRRARKVDSVTIRLPEEDSVTDVLTRALEHVRENSPATSYLRRHEICFPQQQPRRQQRRLGPHARTTDIQVRSLSRSFLDLRIEAKVLFDTADVAHYCGEKGLLRFSDAEPYTDQPIGMMIGYSLRDDARWLSDIEQTSSMSVMVKSFEDVLVGERIVRMSISTRQSADDVSVVHLLLPFRTDPDCR
ncbi:hypothetical protein [Sphingomonas oryzagri]